MLVEELSSEKTIACLLSNLFY